MVALRIDGASLELPRNLALLDSNVLVAISNPDDELHDQAKTFIEEQNDFSLIVVLPVLVEACGLLYKRRDSPKMKWLLNWVVTPGNALLLPSVCSPADLTTSISMHSAWVTRFRVDYVDTYLIDVAHRLTSACQLRPHAPIVTFDTSDFLRCSAQGQFFSVYDMRDFRLVDFEMDG